ncbi:uracil-DNA glycosylase [Candidatus Campbellbacteria bacterium CG10_big_fil_rev_8_21_14_0_10_35_52]|uniref:Uracil-DNA glycosylase n=1 Tax=Candidatus Campbellbacteria bacterium CG10_big_fil_rev_8_21_14_0_10_35_52 TaxID=1974527 RepID=A0A2M6WV77_9BACT|nr:MAG: uracil-DNA glycosylase [Candidatus Campbellbacteria bacterium CG10_big_fil_rev_8_21_14_0_10_35_52]
MTTKTTLNPQIEEGWKKVLIEEFSAEYMKELKKKLAEELESGVILYPPPKQIFNAFNLTPFDKVKVVILGQDPYHGRGQAHGLSFSVPDSVNLPPSLINIFKEIESDLAVKQPKTKNGNLEGWAKQGVLLLNAILTVRANSPASHRNLGWEKLTNAAIKALSDKRENIVFLLWGKFAQEKENLIDGGKHLVLKAPHPSPFSASSGFFGCKHFSKTNAYFLKTGQTPIGWV